MNKYPPKEEVIVYIPIEASELKDIPEWYYVNDTWLKPVPLSDIVKDKVNELRCIGDMLANNIKDEHIICSAIWYKDGMKHEHQPKNIEIGFVVSGRRHHNCFFIASVCLAEKYSEAKGDCIQGFLTSKDNFLDRKQAAELAFKMKQIKEPTDCLFSEDLY